MRRDDTFLPIFPSKRRKKRVRHTDPGLDISDIVRAIDQRDLKKAGTSLLLEVATDPSIITYWSPLLIGLVQALVPSSKKLKKLTQRPAISRMPTFKERIRTDIEKTGKE